VSENIRGLIKDNGGDYVPVFLSQIPQLFKQQILPIDVAMIQVSPPDSHGYCSLGTSVDIAASAVENAQTVIALVNPRMPRTHGNGFISINDVTHAVWHEAELPEINYS